MKRVFVVLIVLLWIVSPEIVGQSQAVKTKINAVELTAKTADGLEMYAWLTPSPHGEAPLFVLLPMMGHTHTSFNPFIKALYERYKTPDTTRKLTKIPHILNVDLRGHGKSVSVGERTLTPRTLEREDFAKFPTDVKTIVEKVLADTTYNIIKDDLVIIGASIGANTAIMVTEVMQGVERVVMLSPGENYLTLKPSEALAKFNSRILIFAGEQDVYTRTSSEQMAELNKARCTLKVYEGPAHGTDLIDGLVQAREDLIDWLVN